MEHESQYQHLGGAHQFHAQARSMGRVRRKVARYSMVLMHKKKKALPIFGVLALIALCYATYLAILEDVSPWVTGALITAGIIVGMWCIFAILL